EACLQDAGYRTIGPAFNARHVMDLIGSRPIDAAILDVGLIAEAAPEIMNALNADGTPLVFMTGYRESELPSWAPPAAFCVKPCALEDLIEKVDRAFVGAELAS